MNKLIGSEMGYLFFQQADHMKCFQEVDEKTFLKCLYTDCLLSFVVKTSQKYSLFFWLFTGSGACGTVIIPITESTKTA